MIDKEMLEAYAAAHPDLKIDMDSGDILITGKQPIKGVPLLQMGERFAPYIDPTFYDCNDDKTIFYFYYAGPLTAAKVTVDTNAVKEYVSEISLEELNALIAAKGKE